MDDLACRIRETAVPPGSLAIFWLAQAGFVHKTPAGAVAYVDPYLSDCVHRLLPEHGYGFKRIMASPIAPEEVEADWVVSTHAHADHLDCDAVPVLARNPRIHFVGAPDCQAEYERLGLPRERFTIIRCGETLTLRDLALTGVPADHGHLAPEALGVVVTVGDIRVWHVGDSAYRPDLWQSVFDMGIDVIIPPINGAFGNLDGVEAARLARAAGARVVIPCHFWMFAEHGGDPAGFLRACKAHAPHVRPLLMTQGESF
ncbi:MAG: MBL fold metallo-hydrolase, partial [Anaerolineae bacterium]|nr:MBL fold metallo-hydrolase [Anaerolineae bacterium]